MSDYTTENDALVNQRVAIAALIATGRHTSETAKASLVCAAERLAWKIPARRDRDAAYAAGYAARQAEIDAECDIHRGQPKACYLCL